ncbi:hypothetical protein D3C72_1199450 [compost metagenome]
MLIWHYRAVMNFFAEDTIRRLHPMHAVVGGEQVCFGMGFQTMPLCPVPPITSILFRDPESPRQPAECNLRGMRFRIRPLRHVIN